MKLRLLLTLGAIAAMCVGASAQQTIFTDDFSDGNRNGWFTSSSSGTLTVSSGALYQTTGTGGRSILTYFTPTSLEVGETLSLSFNLNIVGPAGTAFSNAQGNNNQLRFGLYDSGGVTPVVADNFGSSSYPGGQYNFGSQDGYASVTSLVAGSTNSDGTPAGWTIRDRTGTNTALISTTTGYTTLGAAEFPSTSFAVDTLYTGMMTITRTVDGVDITATFTGGALGANYTISRFDDTDAITQFDMLAFHLNSNVAVGFLIDNVQLSLTAAPIPEPSTYAALAGLLALGLAAWRRRNATRG